VAAGADAELRPLPVQPHRPLGAVGARRRVQRRDDRAPVAAGDRLTRSLAREDSAMNAIDVRPTTTSVYGAVQLGYALVDSPRLAEWKRFGAEGIGMALADSDPDTLAFRTDSHARRLIVRNSAKEDLALGWKIGGPGELNTILGRLAARGVKVEEI